MTYLSCSYTASRDCRGKFAASHPPYVASKAALHLANSNNTVETEPKRPRSTPEAVSGPCGSPAREKEKVDHHNISQDMIPGLSSREDSCDITDDGFDQGMRRLVYRMPFTLANTAIIKGSQNRPSSPSLLELLESHHPSRLCSHNYVKEPPQNNSDVVYCHYTFLVVSNIKNIPHQDINFLELEGCFRVPIRSVLDQFVVQYFLHVHPIMPLLNEGDFWDVYDSPNDIYPQHISLLLFQAMLFASCTFIPESAMCSLGFPNTRTMKSTLLRRTKLLYDFQTETCPLVISQATLLLTLSSLSSSTAPDIPWLSLAIQYAQKAEAHRFPALSDHSEKELQARKRVWWCCIIQDRSIGLLLRRPLHITNESFDFGIDPLNDADLDDETDRSKVYDGTTKKRLAQVFARWVRLCIVLTDIVLLAFPPNNRQCPKAAQGHAITFHDCKAALRRWYTITTPRLPKLPKDQPLTPPSENSHEGGMYHPSVTLYTELMYMYYYMARVTICHCEMFRFAAHEGFHWNISPSRDAPFVLKGRDELQDAISAISDCHKVLVRLRLTRWLPIPALCCIMLPLVLSILDLGSSLPSNSRLDRAPNTKQQRANILVQVMETYWPQCDGVDWAVEVVRNAVSSARTWSKDSFPKWADVINLQPQLYLRLALAIDLSLSKGSLPTDQDFPGYLMESVSSLFGPSGTLFIDNCADGNANHPLESEETFPGVDSHLSTPSDSSSTNPIYYPFGIDEAFIGNLEEQIHSCSANHFPDNGLAQFMDVGMRTDVLSHESQAQSSPGACDDSSLDGESFDGF